MATTLLEVVRLSTRHLAERGMDSPRLDAELLAAHALGLRRIDLYLQYDRPLDEEELAPIRALLRRRGTGEPVAYILGEREFYGRTFAVSPAVLIPRPDTELLVERALAWLRGREAAEGRDEDPQACGEGGALSGTGLTALDLGTGSGCLAVTLACEFPGLRVLAGDISPDALAVAAANASRHGAVVEIRPGSWWEPFSGETLDLVVSNPPYITDSELASLAPDVRDHEPHGALAAGTDGLAAYRSLLGGTPGRLRPGGLLLLEIAPGLADAVAALVQDALPAAAVAVYPDLAGLARCVEARLP